MMPQMPYWTGGLQWPQQQQMAVSAPRPQDLNFHHYLQAQLANWRPFVEANQQPTQLQTRHAPPHGRLPPQRVTMDVKADFGGQARLWPEHDDHLVQQMNSSSATALYHPQPDHFTQQPSFFNDELDYRPEEAALYDPNSDKQLLRQDHPAMQTLTLPFDMSGTTSGSPNLDQDFHPPRANSFDHGRVTTYVDPSQYQPVLREDWNRASIDFDDEADSPASMDTYSSGPFTPVAADDDPSSFIPRFPDDLASSFNSNASSTIHHANRHDTKPLSLPHEPSYPALSTTLQHTGLPIAPQAIMPFDPYAPTTLLSNAPPPRPKPSPPLTESAQRRQRDDYLLSMRERGLSYREIKRKGKFREAESTLRGRVRVLTKDKSERVRRPEWTDMDVRLLRRAVGLLAKRRETGGYVKTRESKVPWKRISGWMRENGGSYLFAPATCAKKWEEIGSR